MHRKVRTYLVGLILLVSFSSFHMGKTNLNDKINPRAVYTSVKDGDWSTPGTWDQGAVPGSYEKVIIQHNVTVTGNVTRDAGTTTTVNTGGNLTLAATLTNNGTITIDGTCQIDPGGWATGNNDFVYGANGSLVFNTNYKITPGQRFWPATSGPYNVTVNSGYADTLNEGSIRTIEGNLFLNGGFANFSGIQINGNLQMNAGGFVDINSPTYGTNSTLIYNTGGTYGNSLEWTAATTPHNVTLQNNTALNYPKETGDRYITGDLTIEAGSALYMDWGGASPNGALTVDGDVNIAGALSLGKSYGDDLKVAGDFNLMNSGSSFFPNGSAIFFISNSGIQMINTPSAAPLTLDYLLIGEGGNTIVRHNQDITVTGKLTIAQSATLTSDATNPGGYQITIKNGSTGSDFDINGTYVLFGNAPVFDPDATATVFNTGLVRADDDIGDDDSEDFASSSAVYFLTDAIFEWNNTLSFDGNNTTYFQNSIPTEIPIFKISRPSSSNGTLVFNGELAVNANLDLGGVTVNQTFRNGITGSAILTQDPGASGHFIINGQNANLGGNGLTINLGSQLELDASVTIPQDSSVLILGDNIDNSTTGNTLTIDGTLDMQMNEIITPGAEILISGTGLYRTAHPGGFSDVGSSIPSTSAIITLQPGSTVELYAPGNQALTSRGDFKNLIFSGSGFKDPSSGFDYVGTITIKDAAVLDCTGNPGYNIGGPNANLVMEDNSRLIVNTTGTQPHMEGSYTLTGGTIEFAGSNSTTQSIRSNYGTGPAVDIIYHQIEVTGSNVGNSNGNTVLGPLGSFIIKPTGVYTINADAIVCTDGTASVTVENNGIFYCGTTQGFHGYPSSFGSISSAIDANITNITLEPGSTVVYMGNSAQPITNKDGLIYQNLTLDGAFDRIAPVDQLLIQGNFNLMGGSNFVHNNGEVLFTGNATQQITVSGATNPEFYDLTNQNAAGLQINSNVGVANIFTLGNNSLVDLEADITMRSGNGFTASMAPIPGNATIQYGTSGRFVVERYIPNHSKTWQLLSVPTKGCTINGAWQNGDAPGVASEPGQGVNIPGPYLYWSDRGFDAKSKTPGMKTYDPVSNTYVGVQNTSDPIDNVNGYFLFVRGDRNTQYPEPSTATTLHTRGRLYAPTPSGQAPPSIIVPAEKFQMVGNLYPSPIDFAQIDKTNLDVSYYIWDPSLSGGYGVGGFRTISEGTVAPQGGAYFDGNIPPIQSGQAFFVSNIGSTDGSVSFEEDDKTTGSVSVFRPTKREKPQSVVRVNLYVQGNQPVLLDGAVSLFNKNYEDNIARWDARKMDQSGAQISIFTHQQPIAIERSHMPKINDTIFYQIRRFRKGEYIFEFINDNMDAGGLTPFLGDRFTKIAKELAPDDTITIHFQVTGQAASKAANRFYIFFKDANWPLPLKFMAISAVPNAQNDILLKWKFTLLEAVDSFVIETANDGIHFNPIIGIKASFGNETFQWVDKQPGDGIHYYRVIALSRSGKKVYSDVVNATITTEDLGIYVFPNPVREGKVQIRFSAQIAGKYLLTLISPDGAIIRKMPIQHKGGTAHYTLHFTEYLADGSYLLSVLKPGGAQQKILLMKTP